MVTTSRGNGTTSCSSEVIAHLRDEDLLQLAPGERLWKLYCFRPADGQATGLRHRIYTKMKEDGRLTLVTFALADADNGHAARSGIARVADLTIADFEHIIEAIRRDAQRVPTESDVVDLSTIGSLDAQFAALEGSSDR
jgi:hypothetical protein